MFLCRRTCPQPSLVHATLRKTQSCCACFCASSYEPRLNRQSACMGHGLLMQSSASPHCLPHGMGFWSLGFVLHDGHFVLFASHLTMQVPQKLAAHAHDRWCGACMTSAQIEQTTLERGIEMKSSLLFLFNSWGDPGRWGGMRY